MKVGVIELSMRLPGFRRVGLVAHHAECVRRAGLEREVVHLVVEQHAGAGRDQPRAVKQVHRLRAGDAVAFGVDDGEVRGLFVFQRRLACPDSRSLGVALSGWMVARRPAA